MAYAQGKSVSFYAKGTRVVCPHCAATQPDEVECYVIAGTQRPVTDSCENCHLRFRVQEEADGQYSVLKLLNPPKAAIIY